METSVLRTASEMRREYIENVGEIPEVLCLGKDMADELSIELTDMQLRDWGPGKPIQKPVQVGVGMTVFGMAIEIHPSDPHIIKIC